MASVDLNSVSKVYRVGKREEVYALTNLTLHIPDKGLVVLVGPSGSGKTNTLRLIAGLEELTGGTISIGKIAIHDSRPQDREISMVFQRDALFPHMTVFENMALGAQLRRVPKVEIEARVRKAAAALNVTTALNRYPAALSSGQRQRVAIGRAIVRQPKVYLFDEPLSHLDAPMRAQMRAEMARLHDRLGATIIYVTHDQAEAMTLGQVIAVVKDGTLQQVAPPLIAYNEPANLFVASFLGTPPMNLFRGRVIARDGAFLFQENNPGGAAQGLRFEIALPQERGERLIHFAEGNVVLGLRPEHVSIREGPSHKDAFALTVEVVERFGVETHLHFNTGAHVFVARVKSDGSWKSGERIPLRFEMQKAIFFNPASEAPII